jgi:deazaflavin-dependent oxidoreductase (nitroreductase family)
MRIIWFKIIDKVLTPIVRLLYRLRLGGWVPMAILTHVGRRTGKVRQTFLYMQCYDPVSHEVTLVSAFGLTDWYKNICAAPAQLVTVGNVSFIPQQRLMDTEEIAAIERQFRRQHPIVARIQAWLMDWPWRCTEEEFMHYASSLRGVVLRPK